MEPNQVEPQVVPAVQPVVEQVVEPVEPGQGETTTEPTEPQQPDPNDQFLIKAVVDGQEQVFDIRDAEQRKQLQDNVQKGVHYTKKMKSVSEWEKANLAQTQFAQMIMGDPDILRISVARQNGLDPSALYGELKPPDPSLAEVNQPLYSQLFFEYQTKVWQRDQINKMTEAYGKMQSDMNNNALFERARIEHELTDLEFNQVKNFLQMNFKPNAFGMFSKEQMDVASDAVVGKNRQAQQQMNTIKKIDQSIKSASQTMNTSVRTRSTLPEQKERDKFHDFVREIQQDRNKRS